MDESKLLRRVKRVKKFSSSSTEPSYSTPYQGMVSHTKMVSVSLQSDINRYASSTILYLLALSTIIPNNRLHVITNNSDT
jgi:hypothetical protein